MDCGCIILLSVKTGCSMVIESGEFNELQVYNSVSLER